MSPISLLGDPFKFVPPPPFYHWSREYSSKDPNLLPLFPAPCPPCLPSYHLLSLPLALLIAWPPAPWCPALWLCLLLCCLSPAGAESLPAPGQYLNLRWGFLLPPYVDGVGGNSCLMLLNTINRSCRCSVSLLYKWPSGLVIRCDHRSFLNRLQVVFYLKFIIFKARRDHWQHWIWSPVYWRVQNFKNTFCMKPITSVLSF